MEAESKKDTSNNLLSDPGETIKAFEKSLKGLENMLKLLKSDINKLLLFDVANSVLPYNSPKTSLRK